MENDSVDKRTKTWPDHAEGSVQMILESENAEIILRCIERNIFYGVMPVTGDSMTCDDDRCIPDNSGVLVYDLEISLDDASGAFLIPLNVPLVLFLENEKLEKTALCKTVSFLDLVNRRIKLKSYNPAPGYNGWVSMKYVKRICKVLQAVDGRYLQTSGF